MAPGSEIWYSAGVRDERQWGYHNVYGVRITHKPDGEGGMISGEKRFSKVALYVHGPGGYQENEEMLNLVSGLLQHRSSVRKHLRSMGVTLKLGRLLLKQWQQSVQGSIS